jgi:hypothetical protein
MTVPQHYWTCQRCRASNAAGAGVCAECGLPAWSEGRQVADTAAFADPAPAVAPDAHDWIWSEWKLLVPEIFLAGAVLLASPLWFISLERRGHVGAAMVLLLGVAQAVFVGRASFKMKSAGGLHLTSWVTFVAALIAWAMSRLSA